MYLLHTLQENDTFCISNYFFRDFPYKSEWVPGDKLLLVYCFPIFVTLSCILLLCQFCGILYHLKNHVIYFHFKRKTTNKMDVVRVLESYRGRDRIIRLSTYVGMFVSGDRPAYMFDRIRAICTDLSGCRVMLRLFDDLSMLMYNLSYGTGSKVNMINLKDQNMEHIYLTKVKMWDIV